jgi:hypothetical protein
MRKFLFLLFVLVAIGCSDSNDSKATDDIEFLNALESAGVADLPEGSLPEWLVIKINEIETLWKDNPDAAKIKIYRGEWMERIIYFIHDLYASCGTCDLYYEDGKKINFSTNFYTTSKNWILIYKLGDFTVLDHPLNL